MKEPLRVPLEAAEPDLAGPRLVHETGGDNRPALPSFCAELREARQRGGYSVADAAHVLRIQEHYLEALEEGRFDQIPGTTYTIGFLRSYAGFLGLDPDEIIDAYKREQGLDKNEQRLAFPSPTDSSPKPKFWLILLVLVLAGLAYGGWQYQSTGGQIATDLVDDVSARLTEAVGLGETEVAAGGAAGDDAATETAAAALTAEATAETGAESAVAATEEPAAETATAPIIAEATTAVTPDPASGHIGSGRAGPRPGSATRGSIGTGDPRARSSRRNGWCGGKSHTGGRGVGRGRAGAGGRGCGARGGGERSSGSRAAARRGRSTGRDRAGGRHCGVERAVRRSCRDVRSRSGDRLAPRLRDNGGRRDQRRHRQHRRSCRKRSLADCRSHGPCGGRQSRCSRDRCRCCCRRRRRHGCARDRVGGTDHRRAAGRGRRHCLGIGGDGRAVVAGGGTCLCPQGVWADQSRFPRGDHRGRRQLGSGPWSGQRVAADPDPTRGRFLSGARPTRSPHGDRQCRWARSQGRRCGRTRSRGRSAWSCGTSRSTPIVSWPAPPPAGRRARRSPPLAGTVESSH